MARGCSQCRKKIPTGKGTTIHYYTGSVEKAYRCCSTPCIDTLKAKKIAEGFGRPGVK